MASKLKPGRALICGSLAFDTIMVFDDRFANHILPDKIHMLNVSFLVPQLRREFGGCAGNIAYNLKLLGDTGVPMATVGSDFAPYKEWMAKSGVPDGHVRVIDSELTAQAFITTDLDDNQITAFHPGAMQHAHVNKVTEASDIVVGIVAPDGRQGMIEHAAQFCAAGIPFIFDPGQGLPMFGADELQRFVGAAHWVTVNEYEWQLVQQKTGWDVGQMLERVEALIVTRGAAGSAIHTREGELMIRVRPGERGGRPHRLRRCLPRRPHPRPHARAHLERGRTYCLAHGGHQDRVARDSEPSLLTGGVRAAPGQRLSLMRQAVRRAGRGLKSTTYDRPSGPAFG